MIEGTPDEKSIQINKNKYISLKKLYKYIPLLTSRAAALCDIGKWKRAKNVIGKALALGGSGETFAVVNRIKKERAELY